MTEEEQPELIINAVQFGEGVVSIQYAEGREQSQAVAIGRQMVLDEDHFREEVDVLNELLEDIVDKGLLLLRNPPKKLRRTRRLVEDDEYEYEEGDTDGEAGDDRD